MTTEMRLDKHAYRGAPRRIGSSWSAIEANPPSADGWAEHNEKRNWNYDLDYANEVLFKTDFDTWLKQTRVSKRPPKSQEQQARDLLAKLLCGLKK